MCSGFPCMLRVISALLFLSAGVRLMDGLQLSTVPCGNYRLIGSISTPHLAWHLGASLALQKHPRWGRGLRVMGRGIRLLHLQLNCSHGAFRDYCSTYALALQQDRPPNACQCASFIRRSWRSGKAYSSPIRIHLRHHGRAEQHPPALHRNLKPCVSLSGESKHPMAAPGYVRRLTMLRSCAMMPSVHHH